MWREKEHHNYNGVGDILSTTNDFDTSMASKMSGNEVKFGTPQSVHSSFPAKRTSIQ